MKRILFILNGLLNNQFSGGDDHAIEVARRWRGKLSVTFLTSRFTADLIKNNKDVKGINFKFSDSYFRIANSLLMILLAYIYRIIKSSIKKFDQNFDVIISSSYFLCDVIPAILLRNSLGHPKLVVNVYHFIDRKKSLKDIFSLINQYFSLSLIKRNFDIIFVDNSFVKDELIRRGFQQGKIHVLSMGIDISKIDTIRPKDRFDASFLGRLVTSKGVIDLIESWKLVVKEVPKAKLAVIGDGPLRAKLENLIEKYSLNDNIKLFGFVSDADKIKILKGSKIFVFPSHEEGFGIVICEAMACSLPIVAYNLPVYDILYKSLIKVNKNDIKRLATESIKLLKNPKMTKELGKKVREESKKYDWRSTAIREYSILNHIIK